MGVYDTIFRVVVHPALDRDGILRRTIRLENALESPADVIGRKRSEMLRSMCEHAVGTSPFWRERFAKAGIDPTGVREIEDLRTLPLLEKDDLRRELPRIRSSSYTDADVTWAATGGSTASPMPFVRDRECLLERRAGNWLMFGWMGRRPWHRSAVIWGAPRDLAPRQGMRERLALRLKSRQILLPSNRLDEGRMSEFAEEMRRFRPAYLHGYSQSVALFAAFLRDNSISSIRLSGVSITAETISDDQRKLIGEVFDCRVLDIYGSREFGYVSGSCDREPALHINPFGSIVEAVAPDGSPVTPGEPGQIVITDLLNRATPFIRYRTGDIGRVGAGTCACGRPMGWMDITAGRETDFIITPEKRLVSGAALTAYVSEPGIAKIQLRQETISELEVVYVKTSAFSPETPSRVGAQLHKLLGNTIQLSFSETDEIPLAPSGKFICSTSEVAGRYFRGDPLETETVEQG